MNGQAVERLEKLVSGHSPGAIHRAFSDAALPRFDDALLPAELADRLDSRARNGMDDHHELARRRWETAAERALSVIGRLMMAVAVGLLLWLGLRSIYDGQAALIFLAVLLSAVVGWTLTVESARIVAIIMRRVVHPLDLSADEIVIVDQALVIWPQDADEPSRHGPSRGQRRSRPGEKARRPVRPGGRPLSWIGGARADEESALYRELIAPRLYTTAGVPYAKSPTRIWPEARAAGVGRLLLEQIRTCPAYRTEILDTVRIDVDSLAHDIDLRAYRILRARTQLQLSGATDTAMLVSKAADAAWGALLDLIEALARYRAEMIVIEDLMADMITLEPSASAEFDLHRAARQLFRDAAASELDAHTVGARAIELGDVRAALAAEAEFLKAALEGPGSMLRLPYEK